MNACVCAWTGSYREGGGRGGHGRLESVPPQTGKPELASPLTVVGDECLKIWLLTATCDTHLEGPVAIKTLCLCVQTGCEWEHGRLTTE